MLPPNKETLEQTKKDYPEIGTKYDNYAFHHGSHPDYTLKIKVRIEEVLDDLEDEKISASEALNKVNGIASRAKHRIKNAGGLPVNTVNP